MKDQSIQKLTKDLESERHNTTTTREGNETKQKEREELHTRAIKTLQGEHKELLKKFEDLAKALELKNTEVHVILWSSSENKASLYVILI